MEKYRNEIFVKEKVLQNLRLFLPQQAPLKDFVFQNNLAAFQEKKFDDALLVSSEIFGYKNYLTLDEYRALYHSGKISDSILQRTIKELKGDENLSLWKEKLFKKSYSDPADARIGRVRLHWKTKYKVDLDSLVHPLLYRLICNFLDQGVSVWNFPVDSSGLIESIKKLEITSMSTFFKSSRARRLLKEDKTSLDELLEILVGDESLFEQYLFDQQFAHPGWSGMVAFVETNPHTLLDQKKITLEDFIRLELLFEIDALDFYFKGDIWSPLYHKVEKGIPKIFDKVEHNEFNDVLNLFQQAYEWTYYDDVIGSLKYQKIKESGTTPKSFQALFCIDDRIESIRRYIEKNDQKAETFGTPGHFNLEFYFQPEHSKFYTKVCPAPITPKYLIKEFEKKQKVKKDFHFSKLTNGLLLGWIFTHTLGFWSLIKLFVSVFRPVKTASFVTSFKHMDPKSVLTIENRRNEVTPEGLQVGFTTEEMIERAYGLLSSINLQSDFAPLVYTIGHGSSSANNPFYATMDCGACSCKPGSVNARMIANILNREQVRIGLKEKGIHIPDATQFVGGLHDTARDEMEFFDLHVLSPENQKLHEANQKIFLKALAQNAKERSRRFMSIRTTGSARKIHKKVITRTISLFEPRPELDHATTSLCVIGRRKLTKNLFLDRRSFLNSYDYQTDFSGNKLEGILNAASPVCGGISLSYYFSKVDNQNLGAGTKLPHNVMGLFGVANGTDGDLRPGLPSQMIEVHDPIRLLMVVEHLPEIVLEVIQRNPNTYDWYKNEWMRLVVFNPEDKEFYAFNKGSFVKYSPLKQVVEVIPDYKNLLEQEHNNLPIFSIQ